MLAIKEEKLPDGPGTGVLYQLGSKIQTTDYSRFAWKAHHEFLTELMVMVEQSSESGGPNPVAIVLLSYTVVGLHCTVGSRSQTNVTSAPPTSKDWMHSYSPIHDCTYIIPGASSQKIKAIILLRWYQVL